MHALKHPLPLGDLVRDNLSIIVTHIYSKKRIDEFSDKHFTDIWKGLKQVLQKVNEKRALRACLEMALYLRALDDETQISKLYAETTNEVFGTLFLLDGSSRPIPIREVANKIIHADKLEWDFDKHVEPVLICKASADESRKWVRAEIDFAPLIQIGASMIYD